MVMFMLGFLSIKRINAVTVGLHSSQYILKLFNMDKSSMFCEISYKSMFERL